MSGRVMAKKVALLTAGHLSSCPRLLKEAELLTSHGYKVAIVFLESIPSISKRDENIRFANKEWEFFPITWKADIQSFISKLYFIIFSLFKSNDYIQPTSRILIKKTLELKADFYIAHHPSVLVAAAKAATKYNARYGYDIEDAFPFVEDGRFLSNPNSNILNTENKYIGNAALISTASPLYSKLYKDLYNIDIEIIDLINAFEVDTRPIENYIDRKDISKVSFYWYSQTVGLNRGLKDVFSAINFLKENTFELHIRGKCDVHTRNELLKLVSVNAHLNNIYFHDTISPNQMSLRNKEHDVGLALEPIISLNRDLCISNKILDYIRSGLYLIATNTKGHQIVTKELEAEGCAYTYIPGDVQSLSEGLKKIIENKDSLITAKKRVMQMASEKFNWKVQSKMWLREIMEKLK